MAYDGKDLEIMTTAASTSISRICSVSSSTRSATSLGIPEVRRRRDDLETSRASREVWRPTSATTSCPRSCRRSSRAALKRRSKDIADYPNPDLAIEIDISPPEVDREDIYKSLQVAEIWRFDGEEVTIEQLREDGTYVTVAR